MQKYSKPNLPSPQCIVEDLTTLNMDYLKEPLIFSAVDKSLRDAYNNYLNFKQLKQDIPEKQALNGTLEELNKQLMDNIESMKKQQGVTE